MSVRISLKGLLGEIAHIPKHIRFAVSSLACGMMMFVAVTAPFEYIYITLPALVITSYAFVWFAIYERIDRVEWIMLFVLPVLWTLEWYVFFYMVPVRWLTRLIFSLIFVIVYYILVSVENIYNVGVEKNIQLQKAAITVSTIFLVGLCYLAFQMISSFEMYWVLSSVLVALVSWVLAIKHFWTVEPDIKFDLWQLQMAHFVSVFMLMTSAGIGFVPFAAQTTRPVVLAGIFYLLTNVISDVRDPVIFRQKRREYIVVMIALLLIIIFTVKS